MDQDVFLILIKSESNDTFSQKLLKQLKFTSVLLSDMKLSDRESLRNVNVPSLSKHVASDRFEVFTSVSSTWQLNYNTSGIHITSPIAKKWGMKHSNF